jgi:hypothetical protein
MMLLGCNDEPSEIGAAFFNSGSLDISVIDSSTVDLSTIQLEDLVTSNTGAVLLGSVHDVRLGRITASVFFQAGVSSSISLDASNVEFAHAAVHLEYNGYSYYDTANTMTLIAHRVVEDIDLADDGYLYQSNEFAYDSDPLGKISFKPRPNRDDTLDIPVKDELGESIFSKIIAGHEDIESNDEFIDYLNGFAIVPDSSESSAILGFNSSSLSFRIYYWDKSQVPSLLKHISFTANDSYYHTNIKVNRNATGLTDLSSDKKISSIQTDAVSFIQSGAGLALRIDIPYLRDLRQLTNFYVTRAILEIYPVKQSYNAFTPLPEVLYGYPANKSNELYSSTAYTALLELDYDLSRDTRYELDVTDFVNEQMNLQEFNENGLVFIPDENQFKTTVDRVYFAEPDSEYQTRLKIYYATINE